jgi:hypothetical protein
MTYIEYLRVRRTLTIYATILFCLTALLVASMHGHIDVDVNGQNVHPQMKPPLSALLLLSGFGALIVATIFSASLNRENDTLPALWTKPVARERIAASFIGVDLLAILAAWVIAFVLLCIVPLAAAGLLGTLYVDSAALPIGALIFGAGLMWYALLQLTTANYAGGGGGLVGMSWGLFAVLFGLSFAQFGPLFHGIVMALNYFNPLAYVGALSITNDQPVRDNSILTLSVEWRVALEYTIAAAALVATVFTWKRRQI